MNLKLLAGVAAAAVMVGATGASAQVLGWYAAGDIGYHWPEETEFTATPGGQFNVEEGEDFAAFVRFGYRFTPHWRAELEGGYRTSEPDSMTSSLGPLTAVTGDSKTTSLMGNVIYDILPDSSINPFIGVGVGAIQQKPSYGGVTVATPTIYAVSDEDTRVAYQGILGVAWNPSERLSLDLTYRYLTAPDMEYTLARIGVINGLSTITGDYTDQSVSVGVRYALSEPAAPPPPPPPPPPAPSAAPPPPPPPVAYEAKEFIVYFPFDQFVLTPEAQTVIAQAADYAKAGNATKVVIVGHADTSGSAAYNVKLSERRSKATADALVGMGIAQTALAVDWKGEAEPAVATGDGVKEPLNRRATIGINF